MRSGLWLALGIGAKNLPLASVLDLLFDQTCFLCAMCPCDRPVTMFPLRVELGAAPPLCVWDLVQVASCFFLCAEVLRIFAHGPRACCEASRHIIVYSVQAHSVRVVTGG